MNRLKTDKGYIPSPAESENNRSLGGKELLDIANFCMMLWDRSWE